MKRYLLFAGHRHYPEGGICDLRATADTILELKAWFKDNAEDIADHQYIDNWGAIVDHKTMRGVAWGKLYRGDMQWSSAPPDELPTLEIL